MSLFDVFDVSGSAMSAQTVRLNVTSSNIANAQSVSSNVSDTYRARHPVFATQLANELQNRTAGVQVLGIIESQEPLDLRYEPGHPLADDHGYVAYPNVNVVEEMANMISASRSFQLNVEVMNSAKKLAERILALGQ